MEINPVPEYLNYILYPLVGKRMLELGRKKSGENTYKTYFTNKGVDHTSIDILGGYGSLPLDLRKPIEMEPFDMVTNFGTTEHVSEQEPVWRNIHNLIKVGGVYCGITPLEGDWWWHGDFYPRPEFFIQFARNGYNIDVLEVGRKSPNRNIDIRMTKTAHNEFIMPDSDTIYHNKIRPR